MSPPQLQQPLPFLPFASTSSDQKTTPYFAVLGNSLRAYATSSISSVLKLPDDYVPPTQPPSARQPDTRKSQLLRTYTSLLRSTPLILLFQHNNLTSEEWVAVRRELTLQLRSVPQGPNDVANYSDLTRLQVAQTSLLRYALQMLEVYDPKLALKRGHKWTHDLSKVAMEAVQQEKPADDSMFAQLQPLLIGPIAMLTIPVVSPAHIAAALSVLAPNPQFPAPRRKKRPSYFDPAAQSGLAKLLLVGGKVETTIMDDKGVRWVGGIEGGLDSMRAKVVHMLQSAGLGLTSALEGGGKNLWLTLESRRSVLAEEAGGEKKEEEGNVKKE